jgi:hypothetical protein
VVGSGSINPGDPLAPGSLDYLLIGGIDLADQDSLYVSGAADVTAATYAPQLVGSFTPEAGQTFTPLGADGVTGPFATFTPPSGSDLTWRLDYSDTDITLTADAAGGA